MGTSLPEKSQKQLIKLKIKPGSIVHLFCKVTNPPKNKFIVIVHVDFEEDLLLCFFINSSIHPFIQSKPELYRSQLMLKQADYIFLKRDSFIDCSRVEDQIEIDDLIDHIYHNPDDLKK